MCTPVAVVHVETLDQMQGRGRCGGFCQAFYRLQNGHASSSG